MSELLFFLVGLLLGGCVALAVMCIFQNNRIGEYEAQIRKLKSQLEK